MRLAMYEADHVPVRVLYLSVYCISVYCMSVYCMPENEGGMVPMQVKQGLTAK